MTKAQKVLLFIIDELQGRFSLDKLYIQKFAFLVSKLKPDLLGIYDFEPYRLGMFSGSLESVLERDKELGLIGADLRLTQEGKELLQKMKRTDEHKELDEIFLAVEQLSKEDILYLLYNLYPEFAEKSELKGMVKSFKFQSVTLDLDKLEEGESVVKTDKGNNLIVRRNKDKLSIYLGESNAKPRN